MQAVSQQNPSTQKLLWQSVFTRHFLPWAHAGHVPPPQSISVSVPFLMPSLQVAVAAEQTPLTHVWPEAHVCPQDPQLLRSEVISTQTFPQHVGREPVQQTVRLSHTCPEQEEQLVEPDEEEYCPLGQLVHAGEPGLGAYVPGGHEVQVEEPLAEANPAAQFVQEAEPGEDEKVPAGHWLQMLAPEPEYSPAWHEVQS